MKDNGDPICMKILIVNHEYPPIGGGAGIAAYEIAKHLSSRAQIDVLTCYLPKTRSFPSSTSGVNIVSVPSYRTSVYRCGILGMVSFLLNGARKIRHMTHEHSYDLIHYFFSIPAGILSLIQPRGIPYIVSLHGGDVPFYAPEENAILQYAVKPINKFIVNRAAAVTAVSNDLAKVAKKQLDIRECKVIHNGIDPQIFYPMDRPMQKSGLIRLVCVSRLVAWKRIDLLIRAVAELDGVELEIIGDGIHKDRLKKLAKSMGADSRVIFAGSVKNESLRHRLVAADIFALPSDAESFGIVFVEAMACGLPIIAVNAGGVPEVVRNEYNGLLVRPNDLESLKLAICRMRDDANLRRVYGERGAEIARTDFSWNEKAAQYFDLYQRVSGNLIF